MNYPNVEWMHSAAEDLAVIVRRGTQAEPVLIDRIDGHADVVLQDGRTLSRNGLFTQPRTLLSSPVAEQLGFKLEDGPMGLCIKVVSFLRNGLSRPIHQVQVRSQPTLEPLCLKMWSTEWTFSTRLH